MFFECGRPQNNFGIVCFASDKINVPISGQLVNMDQLLNKMIKVLSIMLLMIQLS